MKETVPASKYVVFTHKGPIANIKDTYAAIHEKHMPATGLKQTGTWFELYDERYKDGGEDSETDIYCSVE